METQVKEYKDSDDYQRDAKKMAEDGWTVQTVTERQPNAGCMRCCFLGLFALVLKPKPTLIVTYTRKTTEVS